MPSLEQYTPTRIPIDEETKAIEKTYFALKPLSRPAQRRILQYVSVRLEAEAEGRMTAGKKDDGSVE